MIDKPIVFISCGQRTEAERQLGSDIGQLVSELTPFAPYFAEYQTSLEGLSKHVFHALNRSVGLIAVLHHRGNVQPTNLLRGSVWVEQEIAIAAFLEQVYGRKLHVAAFCEAGLAREGLRENLLLNPKEFVHEREIVEHLRRLLPTWRVPLSGTSTSGLTIGYTKRRITQQRHDYELSVFLNNHGSEALSKYQVDVEFPFGLLEQPRTNVTYVPERSSPSRGFFRVTQDAHRKPVFPGDTLKVISFEYFVDDHIFNDREGLLRERVRATLYVPGNEPQVVEKSMEELQNF